MRTAHLARCRHGMASSKFISYGATVADLQRLADYVVATRTELGWSQETLAARSRLRTVTLSDIETAKDRDRRPSTLAKLERALGWEPGSVRAVLNGGKPTLVDPVNGPADPDDEAQELMRRRAALVAALRAIEAEITELDGELETRNTRRAQ